MGSSSKSTSTTASTDYADSLNTTVNGTVGQNGLGITSAGSVIGNSLASYTNSFNDPTTISISNISSKSSNIGSGSSNSSPSGSVTPSVSGGTVASGFDWSTYLPYILLALGAWLAYRIATKPP